MAGVPGGLLPWDSQPGMSIESLIKQEPVDILSPAMSSSLFPPDGSSSMETSDPDLNDLLHSLSQETEAVMVPGAMGHVNRPHTTAIDPDHMLGEVFNGFPLENGLEVLGTSSMVNGVGSYSVGHRQEQYNPVGCFPSFPDVNSVMSQEGGFPSLPDVNSVTSHEGLDRLMSMVQRQSEALQSTSHNFSSLHQPAALDTSLSCNPHSSASATLALSSNTHSSASATLALCSNPHSSASATLALCSNPHSSASATLALSSNPHSSAPATLALSSNPHSSASATLALSSNPHSSASATLALSSNPHSSASATLASIASAHSTQTDNVAGTGALYVPRMAQLTEPHTMRTLTEPSAHGSNSSGGGSSSNPFHIDTSRIAAVPMAEQSAELQNLGLTVYNRDDIEQGIMAQVDQAIAEEEQERLKKILEKQLKAVTDDIKTVKQELANTSKVEKLIGPSPSDREAKRKLDAVKRQKENKIKQLKKLKAKRKLLTMKLDGNTEGLESEDEQLLAGDGEVALEEALGLGSHAKETERERMIRQGEMTPFGTVMPGAEQPQGPRLSTAGEMTSFEKYLMDQQQKGSTKKKTLKKSKSEAKKIDKLKCTEKSDKGAKKTNAKGASNNSKRTKLTKSHSSPALANGHAGDSDTEMVSFSSGQPSDRPKGPNRYDAKDKRQYRPSERDFSNYRSSRARYPRLQHNFSGDRRLSDCEEYEDDDVYGHNDQEYVPHPDALMGDDSDYLSGDEQRVSTPSKPKRQKKKTPCKRAAATFQVGDDMSSDEEEEESTPKKKLKRTRDDGDYDTFKDRIRSWKKERLKRKQEKAEVGETDSSDSEFENVDVDDGFKVPSKVWNNLYPYQRTCVRWLYELHGQQAGGIVGDEMGLGKTIQIISFLVGLRVSQLPDKGASTRYRGLGPTLIVCPATVMHQWVREFHKWWPPFRIAILHNSGSYTSSVPQLIDDIASSHGVLVTSYASLTHNQDALLEYDWHYVVLDEGHKIRNPDAQVTVAAKRFRTCHRLILSGSPVQNNLKELWSLFDFIFPGKLGTLPDFMAHFSVPIVQGGYSTATQVQVQTAYKCACVLRDTINPYLLRRMKSDVKHNLSLPDKNEQVLFCRLTEEQRDVYLEYLSSKECGMILKGDFMVFPGLITLRKICNHPDISTGGPQDFESAYREYAEGERQYGHYRRSGKMIVVRSLLQLWRKQGHRVLLFTQSKQMLVILEAFVQAEGYSYLKMDGGTTVAARQPLINKFNQNPSYFVFLLTTRVGGLGVNLTGANRIVIYDPDWNPSTDMQARERAWRIGQTKQVTIYRLLTAGTIEEKIYHRQIFKQFLTNRVLKDPKQRRLFKANDMYELFSLNEVGTGGSTETSAIFAGTGSDVTVKVPRDKNGQTTIVKGKPNRFDVILEQKQREKAAEEEGEMEEDDDCTMLTDYMAATDTSKTQTKHIYTGNKPKGTKKDNTKAAGGSTDQQELSNKEGGTDDGNGKDGETIRDGEDGAKDERMRKMKELARKLSQQLGKGKGKGEEDKEKANGEMTACDVTKGQTTSRHKHKKSKHKDKRSDKDRSKEKDKDGDRDRDKESKHKSNKKHKKKKKKDAVFEGERIAHLSKTQTYTTPNDEEEEKVNSADQDSYVLARLLNKSGVHSALQHDKIMMSSDPDYALVEGEAERVAQEAARALRRSRQQCHSARSGVPTWTGQSSTAPPPKPRFGQKKNSKLLPAASVKNESLIKTSPEKKPELARSGSKVRHFDGTLAGNVQTDTGAPPGVMTSTQLLSRMKARNSLSIHDDGAEPTSSQSGLSSTSVADIELITDIRNFIAFQSHVNGQASTQEIVDHFKKQIPAGSSPAFKAMLKQVCELHKRDGVGLWLLKPEFR